MVDDLFRNCAPYDLGRRRPLPEGIDPVTALLGPRAADADCVRLEAAGKQAELLLLEGAPHAFQIDWKGDANRRANAAMDVFVGRVL